ncbi:MAG: NADPH:quinone reductase [Candidatus Eremiobacteraeota bacterium]|nr:NADPH:quinone reductase [Candidatus Eremiobacteraeota bacterium]MCW5871813.1 NADPH:quinone reductase [Candidatus Eremiobacteraeota bacterium]
MRAIQVAQFGEPEVLKLVDLPDPQPGPHQVVVRLHAVGVNPVDTYIRSGAYGERPLPYTPGTDAAGEILRTGSEVKHWKVGDRCYLTGSQTGTYADTALCLATQVQPLPEKVTYQQGAALYVPYSTAYRALFQRGDARPGQWLLIHGASGGVGLAATQWARAHGLRIIGTAGSDEGLRHVLEQGAHYALDHRSADYRQQIADLTGGNGPDLILEMLANVNLQHDLDMLARYGTIVVIGNRGNLGFNPRATMSKDANVHGMSLFNTPPGLMEQIQAALVAGLKQGFLNPVVGREFPLEEAAAAHTAVLAPGALGKIVLIP